MTRSVIVLVARCTTEGCHTSIRPSMCQKWHYDNTQFSQWQWTGLCGAENLTAQQCLSKYTFAIPTTRENAL